MGNTQPRIEEVCTAWGEKFSSLFSNFRQPDQGRPRRHPDFDQYTEWLGKRTYTLQRTVPPFTVHPDFPMTKLAYFCLTEDQLDSLNKFYDNLPEGAWYPEDLRREYDAQGHERLLQDAYVIPWDSPFVAKKDSKIAQEGPELVRILPSDERRIYRKRRLFGIFTGIQAYWNALECREYDW
jgi:hypothetical protein